VYPEYFCCIVFFTALGKLEFFVTDSDMLTYFKFDGRTTYGAMSGPNLIQYCEYIRTCHFRWCHGSRAENRIVVPLTYLDSTSMCLYVFLHVMYLYNLSRIGDCLFDYRTFHIRVCTNLKLNALLQHVLEWSVQKLFASICSHTCRTSVLIFCKARPKCGSYKCTCL
jgi:hypothetical protein